MVSALLVQCSRLKLMQNGSKKYWDWKGLCDEKKKGVSFKLQVLKSANAVPMTVRNASLLTTLLPDGCNK